jgi:hypothetical protein
MEICNYCPWCDGDVEYHYERGVPGPVQAGCCKNCGACQMGSDESSKDPEEQLHKWWRPEPEYCPHNYNDVGLERAAYECEWCKQRMEDFL